jgi:2-oxoglutarate ferredoxin oxidoreductase subunit alpha
MEKRVIDLTVEICGMSGDGTIAAGALLNAAASKVGLSVMAFDTYPAEIRGFGRCVTRSRIGDGEMLALTDRTQVLVSLDDEQSLSRLPFLDGGATVIFDSHPPALLPEGDSLAAHVEGGTNLMGVPFGEIASRVGGTARSRNIVALGALAASVGMPPEAFRTVIDGKFRPKGDKVADVNVRSFDAGFDYVGEHFPDRVTDLLKSAEEGGGEGRSLLSGGVAVSRGAIDAGLKLYFGYPITPATPIMEYLAGALPAKGGKVVQMEDEISSIGAVLGSFYAGRRAMTATSGPGFALMTELITHGVMAEIPAVIVNAQRAGPSTGLPTKTEQSDLHAAVFGGPGDSPRIVLAPGSVSECYSLTVKSFQYAEKYQTPVIVLTDFFLMNRVETVELKEAGQEDRADWNVYPDVPAGENYRRFEVTDSGISPRSIPGMEGLIYTATGLEHSETGAPDYGPETHMTMSEKRHRKIMGSLEDLPPPEEYSGGGDLDVGVVAWGSTFGAALEAVGRARAEGLKAGALKVVSLFPCHDDVIGAFMGRCRRVLIPELNFQGQMANLVGHLSPRGIVRFNRVTGVPFAPAEIYAKIRELS